MNFKTLLLLLSFINISLALPKSNSLSYKVAPTCCPGCSYSPAKCCCKPPHTVTLKVKSKQTLLSSPPPPSPRDISAQHLCPICSTKTHSYCCRPHSTITITLKPTPTPNGMQWTSKNPITADRYGFTSISAMTFTKNGKFMALVGMTIPREEHPTVPMVKIFYPPVSMPLHEFTLPDDTSITSMALSEDTYTLFLADDRKIQAFTRTPPEEFHLNSTIAPIESSEIAINNQYLYAATPENIQVFHLLPLSLHSSFPTSRVSGIFPNSTGLKIFKANLGPDIESFYYDKDWLLGPVEKPPINIISSFSFSPDFLTLACTGYYNSLHVFIRPSINQPWKLEYEWSGYGTTREVFLQDNYIYVRQTLRQEILYWMKQ